MNSEGAGLVYSTFLAGDEQDWGYGTGQDFTARTIVKQGAPDSPHALGYGEILTYTVRLISPTYSTLALYDPLSVHTTCITDSLRAPPGIRYDPATHAVTGTLSLSAGTPVTITFGAQVAVTGTITAPHTLVNRACVRPQGSGLDACQWSNDVMNFTYVWPVYLPLVMR